jgi:hypothetical protein
MKKTYMKPSTLLTAVGMHKMICVSDPKVGINREVSVDANSIESRRGNKSVWDDEDEEDDY